MSTYYVLNRTVTGQAVYKPGTLVNSARDDITAIRAAGGKLVSGADPLIAAVAAMALARGARGDSDGAEMLMAMGAAEALYADARSALGQIVMPATSFILATGAPLAVFVDGSRAESGSWADGKAAGVRWNNNGSTNAIQRTFSVPPDFDNSVDAAVVFRGFKTGATAGDAVTFTAEVYNQEDGALYDADTNYGGVSGAMTGDAERKMIQSVSLALTAANLAAYPSNVTINVKPTAATLTTDDVVLLDVRVVYQLKLRTS